LVVGGGADARPGSGGEAGEGGRKYVGTQEGVVGPTEQALADHSRGGVVGLVFGAYGECSQSVDLLVGSFGKLIAEQGYAEMGYRTPEAGWGWQRGRFDENGP
jgi:hypothetical protein